MKRIMSYGIVIMILGSLVVVSCGYGKDEQKAEGESANTIVEENKQVELPKTIMGKDGVPMMLIPAGEFQMGGYSYNEKPIHTVYVDAFYMDKYEVTNAQYKKFMDATGNKAPSYWFKSEYNAPDMPVIAVNWYEATAYAKWAGKRLPTEAEWEKAARGGLKNKKYPLGDSLSHDDANYDGTGGKDLWESASPVGSFSPNGYGLHDMAGNVWEWCADWYDSDYYTRLPERNPKGPDSGVARVLRGGSWYYDPFHLRVSNRFFNDPMSTYFAVGFRCVSQD